MEPLSEAIFQWGSGVQSELKKSMLEPCWGQISMVFGSKVGSQSDRSTERKIKTRPPLSTPSTQSPIYLHAISNLFLTMGQKCSLPVRRKTFGARKEQNQYPPTLRPPSHPIPNLSQPNPKVNPRQRCRDGVPTPFFCLRARQKLIIGPSPCNQCKHVKRIVNTSF